jgi:hypothetical protein
VRALRSVGLPVRGPLERLGAAAELLLGLLAAATGSGLAAAGVAVS